MSAPPNHLAAESGTNVRVSRTLIAYTDYKSPYAYLAKDLTYALARETGVRIDWRPYILDIPSFLGSARVDEAGRVLEEERNAHQWRRVRYSYMDCRRAARQRGLVIRGPRKIWDTRLAAAGMLFAQEAGDAVFRRYHDAVFERFWRHELDLESTDAIAAILTEAGADGAAFFARVPELQARVATIAAEAEAAGVFGVPSFLVRRRAVLGPRAPARHPQSSRLMRDFSDLSEREVLALAIANEEEDGRIYADIAEGFREDYPATANVFAEMMAEEGEHRRRLIELYREKFGEHIPLIRRQDVRGFMRRSPVWQLRPLRLDAVRDLAQSMELETQRFYSRAAARTTDISVRKLLGDLAEAEIAHRRDGRPAHRREPPRPGPPGGGSGPTQALRAARGPARPRRVDGRIGLHLGAGLRLRLRDRPPYDAFLVGMAASIGAGISMGFAEALSDNGSLTGRGQPVIRGAITGVMTTIGGVGHTLPFLIPNFATAVIVAVAVVVLELAAISWIRWRFMDTPPISATLQVALGGALVFACGVLIGSS